MGNTFYFQWEVDLMTFIQSHLGDFGTKLAIACTYLGETLTMVAVIAFLYFVYDKELTKKIAPVIGAGMVFSAFIKNIFIRRRPYFDNPDIKCLKKVDSGDLYDISAQGFSFPSGHSTNSMAAYMGIARAKKSKKLTLIASIIIFLIGLSRVCLGVHYPTDVLAGWVLSLLLIALIFFLQNRIKKDWIIYLILVIAGLPGFFFCSSNDFYSSYGVMAGSFAGLLFEGRYVNFEKPKNALIAVLRLALAGALFGGLNVIFKLPFSAEFLESATIGQWVVRAIRYALLSFIVFGLYPLCFKYEKRLKA